MNLTLDHTQRLNLIAMLESLECPGRWEGFAVCRLMEKIQLSDEERERIGWRKMKTPNGQEAIMWNSNGSIEAREYEVSEDDVKRLCNALDKYPVVLGRDKHWWLPLTAQLPQPVQANGDKL
jgi:hypothetical protein